MPPPCFFFSLVVSLNVEFIQPLSPEIETFSNQPYSASFFPIVVDGFTRIMISVPVVQQTRFSVILVQNAVGHGDRHSYMFWVVGSVALFFKIAHLPPHALFSSTYIGSLSKCSVLSYRCAHFRFICLHSSSPIGRFFTAARRGRSP